MVFRAEGALYCGPLDAVLPCLALAGPCMHLTGPQRPTANLQPTAAGSKSQALQQTLQSMA